MGQRFDFKCTRCGYDAEVGGGHECGMRAHYVTIECSDCRALYDVLAGLLSKKAGHKLFEEKALECPNQENHRVKEWVSGGPCPKCGGAMEKGGLTCLWD
jgi:hypothetical protein